MYSHALACSSSGSRACMQSSRSVAMDRKSAGVDSSQTHSSRVGFNTTSRFRKHSPNPKLTHIVRRGLRIMNCVVNLGIESDVRIRPHPTLLHPSIPPFPASLLPRTCHQQQSALDCDVCGVQDVMSMHAQRIDCPPRVRSCANTSQISSVVWSISSSSSLHSLLMMSALLN